MEIVRVAYLHGWPELETLFANLADDCGDARIAQFRRLERWKDRKAETRLNDSGGVGNSASAGHVLSRISAGAAGRAYFGADGT
jgi:hypothetical protein